MTMNVADARSSEPRISTIGKTDKPASDRERLVLRGQGLAKSFGATKALRDFSFDLRSGEVHTIQGENGSGKSTLVKVLAGVHTPDSGTIEIDGHLLKQMSSPFQSLQNGIGTVFQEVLVVGPQSVLQNVWLGSDGLFKVRYGHEERIAKATAVLNDLLDLVPDLEAPVETLSLSDRQACSIARALLRDPAVLILDEATSALDVATRDRLFDILRTRAERGKSVLFISHRMDEVTEISDRVTVMRLGETVGTLNRAEATPARLVQLMTGSDVSSEPRKRAAPKSNAHRVLLEARSIALLPGRQPINLAIQAGEMIGLAGLEGHGQEALLRALGGGMTSSGEIMMHSQGEAAIVRNETEASKHGIAYVPRERKTEALFLPLSVLDNFALPTLKQDTKGGLLWPAQSRKRFFGLAKRLGIRYNDADAPVSTLSGGNQQKIVMARWLAADPKVLLLNDPTRGVDAHTKQDLYHLLQELTDIGLAVIMISSEVDEHLALMDRVLVMRDQEIFRELNRSEMSRTSIVSAFFGKVEQ